MDKEHNTAFKACRKCGESKPFTSEFYPRDRRLKSGLAARCKDCVASYYATYYDNNREHKKAAAADQRKDKEKVNARNRRYIAENREKARAWGRKSWAKWCHRYKEKKRLYRAENAEKIRISGKIYRAKNKQRELSRCVAWAREKRNNNPLHRVRLNVGRAIRHRMTKGGKSGQHTFDLLGYTAEELKRHIERQFQPGMSWENYGEWHIDHIVPVASFSIQAVGDDEFLACWALTNLRPLWGSENLQKKDRLVSLL